MSSGACVCSTTHSLVRSFLPALTSFLCGANSKESACNAGDPGSVLGVGRSPGEGHGHPLHYACPENSMDREEPGGLQSVGSNQGRFLSPGDIWHRLKAPWAVTTGQVLPAPCEPVSGMLLSIRQCAGQNKELCGPERQQRNPFYLISKAPVPGPAPGKSYPAQTFLQCERIKCLN